MFLKLLTSLFTLIWIRQVFTEELSVFIRGYKYRLEYTNDSIEFIDHFLNLKIKKKKCNIKIIDNFNKQINLELKKFFIFKNQKDRDFIFSTSDQKKLSISSKTQLGQILTTLPDEFH